MNANGLALVPCRERGWKMGLVNMLSKENHGWWGPADGGIIRDAIAQYRVEEVYSFQACRDGGADSYGDGS